jgi:hypothetical protein
MFDLMIIEILVDTAMLTLILFPVARHEADYSFGKVAMVTAAIGLGSFLVQVFLFDMISWFTLIPVFLFSGIMIKAFCRLNWRKTFLVIAVFTVFQVGSKHGMAVISSHIAPPEMPPSQTEQALEVGKDMGMLATPARPGPIPIQTRGEKKKEKQKTEEAEKRPSKFKKMFSKKTGKKIDGGADGWEAARKALIHGGSMLNDHGQYVAIVNGEIVEVGDIVSHKIRSKKYRWKVSYISKHNVSFEQLDIQQK